MPSAYGLVPEHRINDAFSGEGARLYGGRWNSPGCAVTYLSAHRSLAALELLVHLPEKLNQGRYVFFEIEFPENCIITLESDTFPPKWFTYPASSATREIGDRWLQESRAPILRVPSVVIREESNFLLNPHHSRTDEIRISKPKRFAFDQRLLASRA